MSALQVYVDGIGLYGPGLSGWVQARGILSGGCAFAPAPIQLPTIESLPPAERRRVGVAVKLALAIGMDAVRNAGADPAQLASVFSSSAGDCDNCHSILEALATPDRAVSPTRFHNSVHNAPSGYWSIATGCMAPSTSLSAYDASFAAALLEAATSVVTSGQACLMLAYDTTYPEPLHALRPIPHPFGIAMLLSPVRGAATQAGLTLALTPSAPTTMADAAWEALRGAIPAARGLPLARQLALGHAATVVIEYLNAPNLSVAVQP